MHVIRGCSSLVESTLAILHIPQLSDDIAGVKATWSSCVEAAEQESMPVCLSARDTSPDCFCIPANTLIILSCWQEQQSLIAFAGIETFSYSKTAVCG